MHSSSFLQEGDLIKRNYVKEKEALIKLINEADLSKETGKSLISKLGISAKIIQSHPAKELHVIAHSSGLTKKAAGIAVSIENLSAGFANELASKVKRGNMEKVEAITSHAAETNKRIDVLLNQITSVVTTERKRGTLSPTQKRKQK